MASFSIFRPALHAGGGLNPLASSASRMGLGIRPAQLRTYYGKRVLPKAFQKPAPQAVARTRVAPASQSRLGLVVGGSIVAAVGLSSFAGQKVHCESARPYAQPQPGVGNANGPILQEEPKSSVNVYQLSFGTVCGLCAGIFIKKGAKAIAFLLGGVYILLQYLNTQRLVSVNWSAIGNRYDRLVNGAAGGEAGSSSATGYAGSTAQRLWNRTTHFLMADFQPRATFMAGLLLGLRLG
ncbi:uncharacterized protein PFL1_05899 [Pseudozyma flocculosa PF-1]|uniref:FUN14 domain-containing protein n=2 Tax=Pseudozyma flocculosa TaxID=84751 RepID=A0A5C3F2U6_9BASI|nr:uncharacterized protein PFL1_05899 [Pseudozyma flocculosa PF-1]EPQ26578.1 hypothetical protein PFL1_05899 [Pseudozyma flocculosa PF-1]SPO38430.1 uncharacterized protein PSFLO_03908 [Pseudozyma flocculosa]